MFKSLRLVQSPFGDGGFDLADAADTNNPAIENGQKIFQRRGCAAKCVLDGRTCHAASWQVLRRFEVGFSGLLLVVRNDVLTHLHALIADEQGRAARNKLLRVSLRLAAEGASLLFWGQRAQI